MATKRGKVTKRRDRLGNVVVTVDTPDLRKAQAKIRALRERRAANELSTHDRSLLLRGKALDVWLKGRGGKVVQLAVARDGQVVVVESPELTRRLQEVFDDHMKWLRGVADGEINPEEV